MDVAGIGRCRALTRPMSLELRLFLVPSELLGSPFSVLLMPCSSGCTVVFLMLLLHPNSATQGDYWIQSVLETELTQH